MEDHDQSLSYEKKQADANPAAEEALPIKGAFYRYDTPLLQLLVSVFPTRYAWPGIGKINPFNFLGKTETGEPNPSKGFLGAISRNFIAVGMGSTFFGMMGFYSKNTLNDIKSIYSEAVGYELGKKTEDVTLGDIFSKSENEALKVTRKAYIERTVGRMAAAATFFVPWHKFRGIKAEAPNYENNANIGTGAVGGYLFGEAFLRDPSFFDIEQKMVSMAVQHKGFSQYEKVQSSDIMKLMMLQRSHVDKDYKWPAAGSVAGHNEQILAERITNLMNQAYNNTLSHEQANFTVGKFNYLVGFGLLDKYPESLAFVEMANKSSDMQDVKQAAAAIKNGQNSQAVFEHFGVDMNGLVKSHEHHEHTHHENTQHTGKKFTDMVRPIAKENLLTPRSHLDFASQVADGHIAI